jgi:hypothetical protein
LKSADVKDITSFLKMHGVATGKGGAQIKAEKENVTIKYNNATVSVSNSLIDAKGVVKTADKSALQDLLSDLTSKFELTASPKTAADVLAAYGYSFDGAEETALWSEYSVPPAAVTNKAQFFRWLQSFFAQYLLDTQGTEKLLGKAIDDPDDAADAVFEALQKDETLKKQFCAFLSTSNVFNFVSAVNGFYDNGGGKAYVYMMGTQNTACSISENQADKLGLYAFDDVDDIALMVAPGLTASQQREMLEQCEIRKDRFAILDGPIVSTGNMDIPASNKGYGAMYVPWLRIKEPSWFVGEQEIKISGPNRRKLIRTQKGELFVPPSGHMAGIIARVDTERGVHKAPANEIVMGIEGLSQNINRLEHGQYNDRGINVIRAFKDRGIRIWGARTLATKSDASWKYINVRRLFIMVEQSMMLGSQWAVFEPNDFTLWKKLTRDIRAYLMRVWRSGALFGQTADDAFYVKCDTETNPRYLIDAGQVNMEIGICPVKPAEFVIFNIGQWDGGSAISE